MKEDMTAQADNKHVETEVALQQRIWEMTTLHHLGTEVSRSLSLEHVIQTALDELSEAINPDVALLFLREDETVFMRWQHSASPQYSPQELQVHYVGKCLCGMAVSQNHALYSKDIHDDPRCTWQDCQKAGFVSFTALPLRSRNDVFGAVGLASVEIRDFREQATFLETMANTIAVGVKNALLHEQLNTHAMHLEQEIAERRQAEEQLQERERFSLALTDTLPALVYVYDMTTNSNVYSNAGIERLLGYTAEEIQAMGADLFPRLIHPDDFGRVIDFQSEILAASDTDILEVEYRITHRDGEWRTWHSYERPFLRHADGSVQQKIGIAIDVTERVYTEEERRHMLNMLQDSQRVAHIGTWWLSLAGRSIHWTDEVFQIFEREPARGEPSMEEFFQYVHPEDRAFVRQKAEEQLQNYTVPCTYNYRIQLPSGRGKFLEYISHPVCDEHGTLIRVIGTIQDTTERTLAEMERQESQQRLAAILESISDAFFVLDERLRVTFFNNAAEQALGRRAEDVLGHQLFDAFPEAKGSVFEANYTRAVKEQIAISFEVYFGVPPYEDWYDVRVYPYQGGISVYFQVTTERKHAEQALRENEERLRAIFDTSPIGIAIADVATQSIVEANASFQQLVGYSLDELKQLTTTDLTYSEDWEREAEIIRAYLQGELSHYNIEKRYVRKDGSLRWVRLTVAVMELGAGQPPLTIANVEDITERRNAEQALLREKKRAQQYLDIAGGHVCRLEYDRRNYACKP